MNALRRRKGGWRGCNHHCSGGLRRVLPRSAAASLRDRGLAAAGPADGLRDRRGPQRVFVGNGEGGGWGGVGAGGLWRLRSLIYTILINKLRFNVQSAIESGAFSLPGLKGRCLDPHRVWHLRRCRPTGAAIASAAAGCGGTGTQPPHPTPRRRRRALVAAADAQATNMVPGVGLPSASRGPVVDDRRGGQR